MTYPNFPSSVRNLIAVCSGAATIVPRWASVTLHVPTFEHIQVHEMCGNESDENASMSDVCGQVNRRLAQSHNQALAAEDS